MSLAVVYTFSSLSLSLCARLCVCACVCAFARACMRADVSFTKITLKFNFRGNLADFRWFARA